MAIATLSRRTSYFALSRSPRYSVLFALPLLVLYELLAAVLAQPGRELRNGADVMLREAFTAVAGTRGPAMFMAVVILIGLFLVVRDFRASRGDLRAIVFGGMLVESIVLASAFGVVVGMATAKLIGSLQMLLIAPHGIQSMDWPTRLMLSLGAGLYEELFFRVLLVTGLAAGARVLLRANGRAAGFLATVVGAVVF